MDSKDVKIAELEDEVRKLKAFKEYFDELYGMNLMVKNLHWDGAVEPFDGLYEGACAEME